jgi:glycosyltransferase involved in cell wall biosynthesis
LKSLVSLSSDFHLLVLDDFLPDPSIGAGFGRMFDAVIELAEAGWHVVHCPTGGKSSPPRDLIDRGISIIEGDPAAHLADAANRYCVVLVSRPYNFQRFVHAIREHQRAAVLIFDSEALWWRRIERQATLAADPREAQRLRHEAGRMRDVELACARAADFAVMVSEEERDLMIADGLDPGRLRVLPPFERGIVWSPRCFAERADVGYVASWLAGSGSPNVDGLLWFAHEVVPLVRARQRQVRIRVTGNAPPPELAQLVDTVTFEGQVVDLNAFYNQIRLAIVPNRFGSGVKLKTVQAIQYGVPIVATSIGAEGLRLSSSDGVRIADTPQRFADAIVRLLEDEGEWQLSRAALANQIEQWRERRSVSGSWPELIQDLSRISAVESAEGP